MFDELARHKQAIVREWLARSLDTYPFLTSRFLLQEKDRFRNPVGHAFQQALPALLDELLGELDIDRIMPFLDELVRMRAVQDFTPSQALAFLFLLKTVLRRHEPDTEASLIHDRIDRLALLAFDLFMKCRERIYEIKANEARRSMYVLERLGAAAAAPPEAGERNGQPGCSPEGGTAPLPAAQPDSGDGP